MSRLRLLSPTYRARRAAARRTGAFTLIEMLVALLIFAMMVRFAVPVVSLIVRLSTGQIVSSVVDTNARFVRQTVPALLQGTQPRPWCAAPSLGAAGNALVGAGADNLAAATCADPVVEPIPTPPPAPPATPGSTPSASLDPYTWLETEEKENYPVPSACFPNDSFLPGQGGILFASATCIGFFTYDHEVSSFLQQASPSQAPLLAWLYVDSSLPDCLSAANGGSATPSYYSGTAVATGALSPCLLLQIDAPGPCSSTCAPTDAYHNPPVYQVSQTYFLGTDASYYQNSTTNAASDGAMPLRFTYYAGSQVLTPGPCPYGSPPSSTATGNDSCIAGPTGANTCYDPSSASSCPDPLAGTPVTITSVELKGTFAYATTTAHASVLLDETMPVPGNAAGLLQTNGCTGQSAPGAGRACGDLGSVG